MGKARRIILFVFGLLTACFGWLFWTMTWVIRSRVDSPRSMERATEIIEAFRINGGTVPEDSAARGAIYELIRDEFFSRSEVPLLSLSFLPIVGLVCMLIAAWPSKKKMITNRALGE